MTPDVSIVLGSLNRCSLLKRTINSVRENCDRLESEIIVVDGGSTDGSLCWLARQQDVLTIVQPNKRTGCPPKLRHTWGEFINLGFRAAKAPWIVMISDDVVLCKSAVCNGIEHLASIVASGGRVGGGAFYWRDYPRQSKYHVKLLPGGYVHINHGIFSSEALRSVDYADEKAFEFYGADGDLTMRLNIAGWKTVALGGSYAEHLNHRPKWRRFLRRAPGSMVNTDLQTFNKRYGQLAVGCGNIDVSWIDSRRTALGFWLSDPLACIEGALCRLLKR